jgi:hypothetical protein
MIEVAALVGLLGVALAVLVVAAIGWLVLKLLFKIVLFPVALAVGAVKLVLLLVLAVLAVVVAPVLLVVAAALLVPLLVLGAFVGLGIAVFAAVT